jgi:hypothetical protein
MTAERKSKPTIDAVNDAIGALSDLLHTLREHAKTAAVEAKANGKRSATKARNGAVKKGKKLLRKAESTGENILDKAAKVWHDITGPEDSEIAGAARTRRATRGTKA